MQLFKISCLHCVAYQACSPSTRMFVNYCGAERERVRLQVKRAVQECRRQRGFYLKHSLLPDTRHLPIGEIKTAA